MNGSYQIEKDDWQKFDTDTKLWMIFNTFNGCREECDKRLTKLERSKKAETVWYTIVGAVAGFFGGMFKA